MRGLNEHPLNQAALVLLRQAGAGPRNVGSLEWTHILSLASLELPDLDEGAEAQEAGVKFAEWTGNVAAMRTALATLQASFGPEAILEMSPRGAAEFILAELGIR